MPAWSQHQPSSHLNMEAKQLWKSTFRKSMPKPPQGSAMRHLGFTPSKYPRQKPVQTCLPPSTGSGGFWVSCLLHLVESSGHFRGGSRGQSSYSRSFPLLMLLAQEATTFFWWNIPVSASTPRGLRCLPEAWRHRVMKGKGTLHRLHHGRVQFNFSSGHTPQPLPLLTT